ncbi:MAG: Na+/H+ antiporter subunit E [Bellilinea sp.]
MTIFLLNVLLALAWSALSAQFDPPNLIFGFLLGYLVLWLTVRGEKRSYLNRVPRVLSFMAFFLKELVKANLNLAVTVLRRDMNLKPGVVAVPIDLPNDAAITLLANLVTLTPGTLALDVSSDRMMVYIHTLNASNPQEFRRYMQEGFVRRVKELFQ